VAEGDRERKETPVEKNEERVLIQAKRNVKGG
jgi:hypothetical protein